MDLQRLALLREIPLDYLARITGQNRLFINLSTALR
jgi:hypothetical protein